MTRLQWVQMPREEALHHPDWPVGRGPLCANSVAKQEAPHHEELPAVVEMAAGGQTQLSLDNLASRERSAFRWPDVGTHRTITGHV
ncbi:uncharacterized protein [Drosophila kikkawai]|uniref:Uncharacterized protein isoform X2 n=1 Tax=Drosophila kikkawai TaxID=30033 RepID=A0ABM4GQE4_DROKI